MYIEESADDLTVTVEGEQYHAEATADLDDDGVDDTAVVETDDGSIAFTDTDADGQADLMTQLDTEGGIVAQARFDDSTGEWVHVDPDDPADFEEQAAGGSTGTITVETPAGEVELGNPTHDTDADGRADSVIVHDPDGDTVIFTDADSDGRADYATEVSSDGRVTISEHTGEGEWTTIERGHLDPGGEYRSDPIDPEPEALAEGGTWSAPGQPQAAEVHVDPQTGKWVRG